MDSDKPLTDPRETEFAESLKLLPDVLRSDTPERLIDLLSTVFTDADGRPGPWGEQATASDGPRASPLRWEEYCRYRRGEPGSPGAAAAASGLHDAGQRARREIAEMDLAASSPALDAASRVAGDSGRLEVFQCDRCRRVLLPEALEAHRRKCVKVPIDRAWPRGDSRAPVRPHGPARHARRARRLPRAQAAAPQPRRKGRAAGADAGTRVTRSRAVSDIRGGLQAASKCRQLGQPLADGAPSRLHNRERSLNMLAAKLPPVG
eukprot:CAMPEP_0177600082 /NCGR_PEP_ID=MMETSP0419_2-20121207/13399_1 /TAXON_ID=582737 /ORGANISM="Tetraselmis sp., Strain GSL018" /LENGTH=262 /DNA_ID=CAMNT_0019092983 /DNA_START=152 /DNA_END=938 /DNA_ORIENTATION=+